ncbi:TPA: hypothetical protein ACXE9F_003706 [Pluralibacter gergoviae]
MLNLSQAQCAGMEKMADEDFIHDTARRLRKKFPVMDEDDNTFHARLSAALARANTLGLKEKNVRRDFLMLEAIYPGFYLKPEVDRWLKTPNGNSPDQRLEDFKHVVINRERRGR